MTSDTSPLPQTSSSVIKWAFVIGITLLANLFVAYLTQALYPAPKWENFCTVELTGKFIETSTACTEIGGKWYPPTSGEAQGYCDSTVTCQKDFQTVHEVYTRNVFIVFVVFGVLMLVGSAFAAKVSVIALGTAFAGVLALIIGSVWHWSAMQEWLRVVVLGLALAGLLFIAWKKFGTSRTP